MDKKVVVYSTPTCPYCTKAKAYLQEKGIEYTEIDVSQDEAARKEMTERTGMMSVPVIDIGGTIVTGFDRDKIDEALVA